MWRLVVGGFLLLSIAYDLLLPLIKYERGQCAKMTERKIPDKDKMYVIVKVNSTEGLDVLEKKVNEKRNEGYIPMGGVSVGVHQHAQAMLYKRS